jgi:hypothetical protein
MTTRTKKVLAAVAVVAVALPLGAGIASAATAADDLEQGGSALVATLEDLATSFGDAVDGREPEGSEGLETEFPDLDPRYVEGPLGGLVDNGPLE